jgi:hypothetical protein
MMSYTLFYMHTLSTRILLYTHHLTGESLVARLNGTLAAARGWAEKLRALRERGGTGADGEDEDFEDEDFEDEDEGEGGESEEETQEDSWTCAACTFQNRKKAKSCGTYPIHHTPYTLPHTPYPIHHTPYTIHSLCTLSIRYVREANRLYYHTLTMHSLYQVCAGSGSLSRSKRRRK